MNIVINISHHDMATQNKWPYHALKGSLIPVMAPGEKK